jgi:hypothetical protein
MNKNKSTSFRKTNAKWINLPSQPLEEGVAAGKVRTYSIRIKLDAPHPSPKTATTRNIDGEFVWDRLVTCKGRAEAVSQAGKWFQSLRNTGRKGGVGKVLTGKQTHECVTVDDNWKECLYGSNFNPKYGCNRLLDEETIKRLIEDSKGNLKVADSPVIKGQHYPSLEWATDKKTNSLPIKIGFSTYSDPTKSGMKQSMDRAVEREKDKKRKNLPSWLADARTLEARLLIKRMKKKGLLESKEGWEILKRVSNPKRARRAA